MTSNRKSDSVSQCVFTWGTILLNFIQIHFKMTEPLAFWKRSHQQEKEEEQHELVT